jgi:small ligand-binding sensory domain FIST
MAAFSLPDWLRRRNAAPQAWCRTALACEPSLEACVDVVQSQLGSGEPADLALVFVSASFASDLPRLLPLLRQRQEANHWLGCVAGGVIGTAPQEQARELEQQPALSVALLRLPGARIQPFAIAPDAWPDLDGPADPWRALVGAAGNTNEHSMLLLIDPGFGGINDLIAGLDYACPAAVKLGGIACPHSAPHHSLLFDEGVCGGAVGCLIDGAWGLDPVVAQGCRPIGPVFEVEQAQRNVVLEVSAGNERKSPVAALQAILSDLTPQERELVKNSLFLGVGRNNFSLDPGQEDRASAFLVRNLVGVDPRNGAVAVAERMRVGQQVQFQLRDGDTSSQELRQLLRRQQQERPTPLVGLLFACLGRGSGLYGHTDGDVGICRELFGDLPVAGAFCNGEVGPVAGATHLHGYTASWAFVVPRQLPSQPESPATGESA